MAVALRAATEEGQAAGRHRPDARVLGRRGHLRPVGVSVVGAAVGPAVGQAHDVVAGTGAERRAAEVAVGPGDRLGTGVRVAGAAGGAGSDAARIDQVRGVVVLQRGVEIALGAGGEVLVGAAVVTVEEHPHRLAGAVPRRRRVVLHAHALAGTRALEVVAARLRRAVVADRTGEVRYRSRLAAVVVIAELAGVADTVPRGRICRTGENEDGRSDRNCGGGHGEDLGEDLHAGGLLSGVVWLRRGRTLTGAGTPPRYGSG